MKQVLIFVNPIAGRGRGRTVSERIERRLSGDGYDVRILSKPAHELSDAELQGDPAGARTFAITIGGDGTLRAAAERLVQFAASNPARMPPILVVPLGTANLMSRHLQLRWGDQTLEEEIAATLATGRVLSIDAARANDRLFLLMAGIGLDASVVHELDRVRKGPIDVTSYTLPLISALRQYDFPPLTIEVDGRRVVDAMPSLAFVGNVAEYGTGFPILTRAKSDDRLLDICVLPCRTPVQLMRLAMLTTTGDHIYEEDVVYTKGASVHVESPQPVPVQIDGEASGHTPLKIDLLPSGVPFIVPAAKSHE
ncbi:MAG TPA: diacylglycerol kinase family protein [Tepidisphaeraceae bacterium]